MSAIEALVSRFGSRIYALEVTNEWDLLGAPATMVADLIAVVQDVVIGANIKIVTGGATGTRPFPS